MISASAIAAGLLRTASGRWPADLRTPMLQEWSAELAAMHSDPSKGRAARALRQLRFALSLAGSPPVEDENGVPRGWRELLPGAGRALQPILMLLGAAMAGGLLGSTLPQLLTPVMTIAGDLLGLSDARRDLLTGVMTTAGVALAVIIAVWAGRRLGRRLPIGWAHGRLRATGTAVIAPFVVAAGLATVDAISFTQLNIDGELSPPIGPSHTLVWLTLIVPLAAFAAWSARRGRRWWTVPLLVAGALAALELVAISAGWRLADFVQLDRATAGRWFPASLLDSANGGTVLAGTPQDLATAHLFLAVLNKAVRPLLVLTAFLLAYGMAAARTMAVATVPVRPLDHPDRATQTPARSAFGVATIVIGLVSWAYPLALLTPRADSPVASDDQLHLWAQELREAGIVLAVLGLLIVTASRGPTVLPGVLVTAGLLTADAMIDTADGGGLSVLTGAFGLGVAIVAFGWWLSGSLAGRSAGGVDESEVRRRLAAVAVIAALCAPAQFLHGASDVVPARYPMLTAIVAATLALVAGITALIVRPGRLPLALTVPLVGGPALTMAVIGADTGDDLVLPAMMLGLPFVALTFAIMTARRRQWAVLRWTGVGLATLALASPAVFAQLVLARVLGTPLMSAAGYGPPADGFPYLPGAALVGVVLGVLATVRVAPRTTPASRTTSTVVAEPGMPGPA